MQTKDSKAIVLLSGGQDSSTCLFWAKNNFTEVIALGFDYGQKHAQELEQAGFIADLANIDFHLLDVRGLLIGSSLTDHTKDHNEGHSQNPNLPNSFTAGRNALFLTIAGAFGFEKGIFDLVTGTCQTDFSGYPDCRRQFIDSQALTLSLALDKDIRIHTPLMYLTKAETWKLAAELNCAEIIRDHTLTDYNGDLTKNEWGYGKLDNPASSLRAKGFYEARQNGWINL
ncbi:MAG TPA: 7-cyano-7-deazaguanine synthase QueC [Pyrinomonadaceae bacterium]|nr:7-cyano-7-deazaguanine synthase QueC [Pyrinomonadaceae bacterium]